MVTDQQKIRKFSDLIDKWTFGSNYTLFEYFFNLFSFFPEKGFFVKTIKLQGLTIH